MDLLIDVVVEEIAARSTALLRLHLHHENHVCADSAYNEPKKCIECNGFEENKRMSSLALECDRILRNFALDAWAHVYNELKKSIEDNIIVDVKERDKWMMVFMRRRRTCLTLDPLDEPKSIVDKLSRKSIVGNKMKFSMKTSSKGGFDIEIGACTIHVPKYSSVHHPLIEMVLFAHTLYDSTLRCLKSVAPKSIIEAYESDLIFTKPKSHSRSTGSACKEAHPLADNAPENHSAPNSIDHGGLTKAEDKTKATWLMATAALQNATGNRDFLTDFTAISDIFVKAGDGVSMPVCGHGSVITDTVVLPDVWFVPGLTENLVSAGQLTELDYSVDFARDACFVRNATDGTVIGKAHVSEDGLFEIDFLKVGPVI